MTSRRMDLARALASDSSRRAAWPPHLPGVRRRLADFAEMPTVEVGTIMGMAEGRPAIPAATDRAVRVEAGHRCAILTCRATSGLQIHHIVDWAEAKQHSFEELILLCANCHARVTSGEIDHRAVMAYKRNLSLLAGRYSDLERRVLERFVKDESLEAVEVDVGHAILLDYLLADGILEYGGAAEGATWAGGAGDPDVAPAPGQAGPAIWHLTAGGRDFVCHLRLAEEVS